MILLPPSSGGPCAPRPRAPRSPRTGLGLLAAGFALVAAPALAGGQRVPPDSARRPPVDSLRADSLSPDSLAARLARAEAAIALLRRQLAEQSESAVQASTRLHVVLSARVLTNAFLTDGRVNLVDVPQVVLAPPAGGAPPGSGGAAGLTLRQTRLGAGLLVDDVLGAAFAADVDVDFSGGGASAPGERRLFPEPRLRTARARLAWARTELLIGSETPLISDLDPISLASVGTPNFSGAGNLWNWLPQLRLTRELGATTIGRARLRWAVQGAVLEPFAGLQAPGEPDAVDAGERSRRPFLEGRLRARWGEASEERELPATDDLLLRGGEVGVGGHRGWVSAGDARHASRALTADVRLGLGGRAELRGEGYVGGQLLRGLGGGAIAQAYAPAAGGGATGDVAAPLRDAAGWAQLNVQPHPVLVGGVGCGVDVVDEDDGPLRERNAVCAAHVLWRPVEPLLAALEFRRLRTRYANGTFGAHHLNLAFGVEF
jgi:hypothetical protein